MTDQTQVPDIATMTIEELEQQYLVENATYKRMRQASFIAALLLALTCADCRLPAGAVREAVARAHVSTPSAASMESRNDRQITGKTYPTTGQLNLTTVNERGGPSAN